MEQLKAYILLYISSKSTRKSTHSTRLCGAAQGLHIAIYIIQKHSYIYTRHKTLWSSSRPTYCYIYRPKALVHLHTAQDSVEQLKAYILLYILSKSTRTSTHGTRFCGAAQGLHIAIYRPKALVHLHTAQDSVEQLKAYILLYILSKTTRKSTHSTRPCGAAQGLHIAIYIVQKHSYIYTQHKTLWSSSRPTYCYIYRPKALVNLHTAQDSVEQLKAYILLYIVQKHS